jgi:hypothetical protein
LELFPTRFPNALLSNSFRFTPHTLLNREEPRQRDLRDDVMTALGDPIKAARIAGRELQPRLKRLLAYIEVVEAYDWDTDWVRLPKRYASAVLTDIEAGLVDRTTAKDAAHRVELLGSELALRCWISKDNSDNEFAALVGRLLDELSKYRGHLRALSSATLPPNKRT